MALLGSLDPVRELVALVVPPACAACGAPLPARLGALCGPCRARLPWLPEPTCPRCALAGHGGRPCPGAGAPWTVAWAPLGFAGPARSLVHALKFRGSLRVADELAAPLAAGGPPGLRDGAVVVPVPADPVRGPARGFDHAGLVARALARRTSLDLAPCLRRAPAAEQVGAARTARRHAVRGTVRAHRRVPRVALLVDDVHTTGATLAECARTLLDNGAREVRVATCTRTA